MFAVKKINEPHNHVSRQELTDLQVMLDFPDYPFNVTRAILIRGSIERDLLESAITQCGYAHDALRTHFLIASDGRHKRVVEDSLLVDLDFFESTASQADESTRNKVKTFCNKTFRAEEWPLVRFLLIKLGNGFSILAINQSHVISDAYSMDALVSDLGVAYAMLLQQHQQPVVTPPETRLSDYAACHREWEQSADYAATLEQYRADLQRGLDWLVVRGIERKKKALTKLTPAATNSIELGQEFAAGIMQMATEYRIPAASVTTALTLLVATGHLGRGFFYTFIVSTRFTPQLTRMMGHLSTTVALFNECDPNLTFVEYLEAVHKQRVSATVRYGAIPFGALLPTIKNPAGVHLDQVKIDMVRRDSNTLSFAGFLVDSISTNYQRTLSNELRFFFTENPDNYFLNLSTPVEYQVNADQVKGAFMDKIRMAREPDTKIRDLIVQPSLAAMDR